MIEPNELYHYGVLGMKWGHRRAQKRGETYTYKSHTTKKYERKAAKLNKKIAAENAAQKEYYRKGLDKKFDASVTEAAEAGHKTTVTLLGAKANKYSNRAKRSAEFDAKEQKQSLSVSTGKTIATRLLLTGGVGTKPYQRYRALGDSKAKAILKAGVGGYPLSMYTKSKYIRQDEK